MLVDQATPTKATLMRSCRLVPPLICVRWCQIVCRFALPLTATPHLQGSCARSLRWPLPSQPHWQYLPLYQRPVKTHGEVGPTRHIPRIAHNPCGAAAKLAFVLIERNGSLQTFAPSRAASIGEAQQRRTYGAHRLRQGSNAEPPRAFRDHRQRSL